jgi:hypothetical protein
VKLCEAWEHRLAAGVAFIVAARKERFAPEGRAARPVLATAPSNPLHWLTNHSIFFFSFCVFGSRRGMPARQRQGRPVGLGRREFTPSHRSGGTLFPDVSGFWFLPLGHGVPPCCHFTGRGAALSVAPCHPFLPRKANVRNLSFFFLIIVIPVYDIYSLRPEKQAILVQCHVLIRQI